MNLYIEYNKKIMDPKKKRNTLSANKMERLSNSYQQKKIQLCVRKVKGETPLVCHRSRQERHICDAACCVNKRKLKNGLENNVKELQDKRDKETDPDMDDFDKKVYRFTDAIDGYKLTKNGCSINNCTYSKKDMNIYIYNRLCSRKNTQLGERLGRELREEPKATNSVNEVNPFALANSCAARLSSKVEKYNKNE